MKTCIKCGASLPEEEFSWKSKAKGTRQGTCKVCMRKYSKAHYQANTTMYKSKSKVSMPRIVTRNKIWVAEYLRMNPCACGVSDIDVLQFDHDTALMSAKARRIGSYLAGSLEALQREIEKCTVRCANCHYKRTRQQMGWSWE